MNQDQVNRLFGAISELNTRVAAIRADINNRFNTQEQRLTSLQNRMRVLEDTATRLGGQPAAARAPHGRDSAIANQGHGLAPHPGRDAYSGQQGQPLADPQNTPRVVGSGENAGFLPFAIELIERKRQRKPPGDNRTCYHCPKETFSLECFREDHFRWCRKHQRPIIADHELCGRDYKDCLYVKWEVHPQWALIVEMSFAAGLGSQGVQNLREKLFPREHFPEKYNNDGTFRG
ncbi:hypothetical protein HBI42_025500 [Parastagonospora nodorum]|nr:hypothetical protein HBI11_217380 [Parastagonospora nodorum]KAH5434059.1 hypothetical protein HBI32_043340 [Parastagonospora nodorum]KAH6075344.1 hypothetical protein HBI67_052540 [Parastagonospora nodorum]KAH6089502.1 hypothetical protein HBI66_027180 [Parastagonospora nodorum]KAH6231371.1 hypothetical protein HBI43_037610 [Parastagonospora nodorum]